MKGGLLFDTFDYIITSLNEKIIERHCYIYITASIVDSYHLIIKSAIATYNKQ